MFKLPVRQAIQWFHRAIGVDTVGTLQLKRQVPLQQVAALDNCVVEGVTERFVHLGLL